MQHVVLGTSNFQGATIRPIVLRHLLLSFLFTATCKFSSAQKSIKITCILN